MPCGTVTLYGHQAIHRSGHGLYYAQQAPNQKLHLASCFLLNVCSIFPAFGRSSLQVYSQLRDGLPVESKELQFLDLRGEHQARAQVFLFLPERW